MCWACYTSLTGGGVGAAALAGAGAGPIGGAAPMTDSGEKKSIDPKLLGIVGVCLLAAVGFGVKTMIGGEGGDPNDLPQLPTDKGEKPLPPVAIPVTLPGLSAPVPLPPVTAEQNKGQEPPAIPYRVVVSPNPRQKWGTVALAPVTGKVSETEARSWAMLAKQNIDRTFKFPAMEIFVINDPGAASVLKDYQNKRRGAPLTEADYSAPELAEVWNNAIVRFVWNGGKGSFSSPAKSPSSFWSERRN